MGVVELLEEKIKINNIDQVAQKMFGGWHFVTNLDSHYHGRIWITWRPDYFNISVIETTAQLITCAVKNIRMQTTFIMTTIYAYNTREG